MRFLHNTLKKIRGRAPQAPLQCGSAAPDFTLCDTGGARYQLRVAAATQPQFLVFIPNAFTPVCAAELTALLWFAPTLQAQLVIITCDSKHTLHAWLQTQQQVPPNVVALSDFWPHGKISRRYGVFNSDSGSSTRNTFLIDKRGRISATFGAPAGQQRDLAEYQKSLAALRHAETTEPFASD